MIGKRLRTPTGNYLTPNKILIGIGLLEISAPTDVKTLSYLLRTARCIAKMP
ncbi:hypothetical protein MACH09_30780 [Vibrio sp. MACH09]|nr:hypothetical protein MACH09_30780 [Vibrio sp. MACH09]